jgi:hypothetical protein
MATGGSMIYYQYSEKFDKLSDAILWSEKQKKRLDQIGSKLFIRFTTTGQNTRFTVYRSQCPHDLNVADMILNEGIETCIPFAEYITRSNHGNERKDGGALVVPRHKLGQGIYV